MKNSFTEQELRIALFQIDYNRAVDDLLEKLRNQGITRIKLESAAVERFMDMHHKKILATLFFEMIRIMKLEIPNVQSLRIIIKKMHHLLHKKEEFVSTYVALIIGVTTILAGGEKETAMKCLKDSLERN